MSMQTELQGAEASVTQSNPLTPISERWDSAYMRRKACEDPNIGWRPFARVRPPSGDFWADPTWRASLGGSRHHLKGNL